jgi:hypothetical protein
LNPVRAQMVGAPGHRPWSSYRAHTGAAKPPPWLDVRALQAALMGRDADDAAAAREAAQRYARLVAAAHHEPFCACGLRQQVHLGDEAFVQTMQARVVGDNYLGRSTTTILAG